MWTSMRGRKRCVVVAQGFYEWLKMGPKERVPHYIRRRDGLPLLLAGLWDCVAFEGDDNKEDEKGKDKRKTYTYTIITTDSNAKLRFLHDRMPVVFDYNSPELQTWLDPERDAWSSELQALLRPWPRQADNDGAALIVDVVSKEVNRAGHSSPSFIVPVASESNRSNIANFFKDGRGGGAKRKPGGPTDGHSSPVDAGDPPLKRTRRASPPTVSTVPTTITPAKATGTRPGFVSATKNKNKGNKPAPARTPDKTGGSQKITSFFGLKNG